MCAICSQGRHRLTIVSVLGKKFFRQMSCWSECSLSPVAMILRNPLSMGQHFVPLVLCKAITTKCIPVEIYIITKRYPLPCLAISFTQPIVPILHGSSLFFTSFSSFVSTGSTTAVVVLLDAGLARFTWSSSLSSPESKGRKPLLRNCALVFLSMRPSL
jgi:hypothetical protein